MSDEKTYTEREVVERERRAVERTIDELWHYLRTAIPFGEWNGAQPLARRLYPLPTVTRPRVVTDTKGRQWKVEDDILLTRHESSLWLAAEDVRDAFWFSRERIRLWADLIANPTETVEDDQ